MITIMKNRALKLLLNTFCFISVCILLNLFQPLYADQNDDDAARMEKAAYLQQMIECFILSPEDAKLAIENLENWDVLSELPCIESYTSQENPEEPETVMLAALGRVCSRIPLDISSLKKLIEYSSRRSTRSNLLSDEERYIALQTANRAAGEIKQQSAITGLSEDLKEKLAEHGQLLITLAEGRDVRESDELRRLAIKGIRSLKFMDAASVLKVLAENSGSKESVPIQKDALIALAYMHVPGTVGVATTLLTTTQNQELFGAAAYTLGQLKSDPVQNLRVLTENIGRNPQMNFHISAAISQYSEFVTNTIDNGEGETLLIVLQALPHIQWTERDLFKGKLEALLKRLKPGSDKQIMKEVLRRLISSKMEIQDCSEIINILNSRVPNANVIFAVEHSYFSQCAKSKEVVEQK